MVGSLFSSDRSDFFAIRWLMTWGLFKADSDHLRSSMPTVGFQLMDTNSGTEEQHPNYLAINWPTNQDVMFHIQIGFSFD